MATDIDWSDLTLRFKVKGNGSKPVTHRALGTLVFKFSMDIIYDSVMMPVQFRDA